MKLNQFFKNNWIHFVVVLIMIILTSAYFSMQYKGYGLKQHDIAQYKGMSNEISTYREQTGKETLWTNSMFGGMPSAQISYVYDGNYVKTFVNGFFKIFQIPAGATLITMLGFYILMMCLRINPWIGLLGAIAYGFASYDIIILQAGHNTKAIAAAFMAPTLGAFILAYQRNLKWGIILSAIFMAFELSANHLQITYYFAFLLLAVGIVFFINAIKTKTYKNFLIATAGVIAAYVLALVINIGNIAITNDYSKHTTRGGNDLTLNPDGTSNANTATKGLDREYVTQWSYGIGESFTLISPYVKGGGSVALGDSPFVENAENSDLSTEQIRGAMNYPVYWGDQPMTSGPVYIGIIVFLMALLGMFFLKTPLKWAFLAVTILTLMLSWGKNFMGLTDFFLDYMPGYNKFRAVTIILMITGLIFPVVGAMLLDKFVKERETIKEKKKLFLIVTGGLLVFLVLLKVVGLNDNYSSESDQRQMDNIAQQAEGVKAQIRNQILSEDPTVLKTQYNIDVNNAAQVEEFVNMQAKQYIPNIDMESIKTIRESIFQSSMNRSILFLLLGAGLLSLLFYTEIKSEFVVIALVAIVAVDLISVSYNYLGNQLVDENREDSYKYWDKKINTLYPVTASAADEEIMKLELEQNPALVSIVEKGKKIGEAKADELGVFEGQEVRRIQDLYRFYELNMHTNYRVFDLNGGFNSANSSYFHKALGGYHGAKLRSIQNLFDFHLSKSNNKIYDMLNVKYFIQQDQEGKATVRQNPTAMGNAWLVKEIKTFATPDEEINALGSLFEFTDKGLGTFLINGGPSKSAVVNGSESLKYVLNNDTIDVPITNGLRKGMEAVLVMDINGKTDYILKQMIQMDTSKSFLQLLDLKVISEFNPSETAVMLESESKKISSRAYTAEGDVKMKTYLPNKITYEANTTGKQFVVFSEVYYADGWKAFVDGKETPIVKTNYILRGIEVPGGKHQIELVYDLPLFNTSNTLARIASIILFLLILVGFYLDYKKKRA